MQNIKQNVAILVGDIHASKDDRQELDRLIDWIISVCEDIRVNGNTPVIFFLGDQYSHFANVRVEVEEFWKNAYDRINAEKINSVTLSGNHDMNQDCSASALTVHSNQTRVVASVPVKFQTDLGAVGFIRDEEKFYKAVMALYNEGVKTVLCHAEFQGCQYENGMYAPHGFDLTKFPSDLKFISGHIHKRQEFGNVWYPGTPRPLTRSDINEPKGIAIIPLNDLSNKTFLLTPEDVCESFKSITINETDYDSKVVKNIKDSSKIYVTLVGTKAFCKKVEKDLPLSVKVRSSYTDEAIITVAKESEGIPTAFGRYSEDFFKTNQVSDDLKAKILKKVYELCPILRSGNI